MTAETRAVLILLCSNAEVALAYMLWALTMRRGVQALYKALIILLCPVVAPIFFAGAAIGFHLIKNRRGPMDQDEEEAKRKFVFAPSNEEADLVPMEESLLVSDVKDRRKAILNSIRGGVSLSGALFSKALANDDPETSHYSATVIMEMTAEYQTALQKLSMAFDRDHMDADINIAYARATHAYYASGILSEIELKKYGYVVIHLLENLRRQRQDLITPELYQMAVEVMLDQGELRSALQWSRHGCLRFARNESMHLLLMRTCYEMGDAQGLVEAVRVLSDANIPLSREGAALVGYFSVPVSRAGGKAQ